jgi:signal transduction histidine kinase
MDPVENQSELDKFLYIISHDLKAPIISIQGYVSLIKKGLNTQISQNMKNYMDRIQINAERLETMVNGLIELSRIGRTDTDREELNLGSLLSELSSQFNPRFKDKSGQFVVKDDLQAILANRGRIKQLFEILLDNSLRHSNRPDVLIFQEPTKEKNTVGICYFDQGGLVAKERVEEIFKLFYTTQGCENGKCLGLGLTLARRILVKHGGWIWAESIEPSGVKFHMTFPK